TSPSRKVSVSGEAPGKPAGDDEASLWRNERPPYDSRTRLMLYTARVALPFARRTFLVGREPTAEDRRRSYAAFRRTGRRLPLAYDAIAGGRSRLCVIRPDSAARLR